MQTLQTPSFVCRGTSNPDYLAYVNTVDVSQGNASPFIVFVDPDGQPTPALTTIGHRKDFKDSNKFSVVWQPDE